MRPRPSAGVRPMRSATPGSALHAQLATTNGALSDYVKVRTVGRGSFGEALLVKHRSSGQMSVLKRVRLEGSSDAAAAAESAAREAQVLQKLRHPHIVEFLGAFVDNSRDSTGGALCLLMAFCEGGDLQHRLQKVRQECRRLPEQPALRWFDQLCSALAYVHQHQVLHRDLKPSNIFLYGRSGGSAHHIYEEESVSIGDFGVSRPLTHSMELVTTMVGTPCYLSPEVCKGKPYSYKSDIWSLGCVLFEMMALRPPFGTAPNLEALVNRIVRADVALPEHLSHDYPEASRCTRAMLRQQPDRRPTAHSLLNRPRLQPPVYELPGMHIAESVSTPSTPPPTAPSAASPASKAFEPPGRGANAANAANGISSQAAKQKLVAAQVAAAAANAAANAVKAAALSPRTRGRAKLANQILESEDHSAMKVLEECTDAERLCPRAGQKGIITDIPLSGRARRQASAGSHGSSSPSHPMYPASPSVAVSVMSPAQGSSAGRSANPSDGSNVRSCSGDIYRPRQPLPGQPVGQQQPLSARQKVHHPFTRPQPLQRSPRKSNPAQVDRMDYVGSGSGALTARSGSATPRSPDPEPEDSKFKQRREERCRQSQAFRKWLREQRAKGGKESPSPGSQGGDISEQSPIQEEPSPSFATEYCEDSEQTPDRLNESREASSPSPSQPLGRVQKPRPSQSRQEWRTEIYCPGFPVMTVEEPATELDDSRRSSTTTGTRAKEAPPLSESDETPCGPADLGGTPSDTPLQAALRQRPTPERTLPAREVNVGGKAEVASARKAADTPEAKLQEEPAPLPNAKCISTLGGHSLKSCEAPCDDPPGVRKCTLDDSKKSVSIGDRIEGIRACLEARMGTQRFQKLYKSLTKDDSTVNSLSGISVPWPRDSSMFLPEDIDEAFSEATTA
ncbi:NEK4, partial [Symbiodinium natans]